MKLKILDMKAEMIKEGISSIDLLSLSVKIDYFKIPLERVMLVEERHLCKLPLISYEAYGSIDHVDVIAKFNQITNPFKMELQDIIMIPSLSDFTSNYSKDVSLPVEMVLDTKSLYLDPSRASKKDAERIKQLQKIADRLKNGAKEIKQTNLLRTGEYAIKYSPNAIEFAPNINKTT